MQSHTHAHQECRYCNALQSFPLKVEQERMLPFEMGACCWPERAQLPAESGRSKVAHRLSAKGAEVLGSDAVRVNGGLQGGLHLRQQ